MELLTRSQLTDRGVAERQIHRDVASGALARVRSGLYAEGREWSLLRPEARHLLLMDAVRIAAHGGEPVFGCISAAAAWGLPVFRADTSRVHTLTSRGSFRHSQGDVVRHRGDPDGDVTRIGGFLCTPLARTLFDVIREQTPEASISCADAALRRVSWNNATRQCDRSAAETLRSDVQTLIDRNPGARGIRQARRVIAFAHPAAQLPGESISRLYLSQLGFAPPRLQVRVPGPRGRDFEMDFAFDSIRAFGEFDGTRKYTDPQYLRGRTPERALLDEKEREDWVRGTTQWRIGRWGMSHLGSARALGERLARFGITPAGHG